jgi:hypothetical protein
MAPGTEFPMVGICQKTGFRDCDVWLLLAVTDATKSILARLVATMLVDDVETILKPMFMPDRSPTALLDREGKLRQGRGFFVAPWAEAEIQRVADTLEREYDSYLSELSAALQQRQSRIFRQMEPGFFFSDPIGSERIGSLPEGIEIDVRQSERVKHNLEWYQVAGQDYVRNRYLLLLSKEELARRVEHIMANTHVINDAGLVSLDPSDPYLRYWLTLLNDVKAEMALRHGPYPAGWTRGMIDFTRMPGSLDAKRLGAPLRLKPASTPRAPYLVKYGEQRHLEPMLSQGRIRVAPASFYADPSLNNAIRDDELSAVIHHDPHVPFNFAPPGTVLLPPGRVSTQLRLNTNYYAYCLSDQLSTRLLLDFRGDSCVLIHDPDAFLERLVGAASAALRGWHIAARHVQYYDPLLVHPAEIEVPFGKHFGQAYQREVRVVWTPPTPVQRLPYLHLELGSLIDIAELVVVPTRERA